MTEALKAFVNLSGMNNTKDKLTQLVSEKSVLVSLHLAIQKGSSLHKQYCLIALRNISLNSKEDHEVLMTN